VDEQQFICSSCGSSQVTIHQVSEVGNIFKLGTKFSDDFGVTYTDQDGQEKSVYMGCYGIGVSRLMGVLAEKFSDDRGLIWSESIAPYTHIILVIGDHLHEAELLAKKLE
jgi:prolyl-tRNA synthetase